MEAVGDTFVAKLDGLGAIALEHPTVASSGSEMIATKTARRQSEMERKTLKPEMGSVISTSKEFLERSRLQKYFGYLLREL
jgi:hypothetical protein